MREYVRSTRAVFLMDFKGAIRWRYRDTSRALALIEFPNDAQVSTR